MAVIKGMGYDKEKHHRRSVRLKGYDYALPGAYFITICTDGKECIFGNVVNGEMKCNDLGKMLLDDWQKTGQLRDYVEPADFVVMPNHVHGIIIIHQHNYSMKNSSASLAVGAYCNTPLPHTRQSSTDENSDRQETGAIPKQEHGDKRPAGLQSPSIGLGAIVRGFKSACAAKINRARNTPGAPLWQRSFHDHVIGNNDSFERIRAYIRNNPALWEADKFYVSLK